MNSYLLNFYSISISLISKRGFHLFISKTFIFYYNDISLFSTKIIKICTFYFLGFLSKINDYSRGIVNILLNFTLPFFSYYFYVYWEYVLPKY